MFTAYVKDMKSWILLFATSLVLTDILIWVDKGLAMRLSSLIYLNMLLIAIFISFLMWRYKKEMHFMKELLRISEDPYRDWQEGLPEPLFVRDQTTNDLLRQVANDHLNELSEMKAINLKESDYTAAWVHEVKAPLTSMKMTIDANPQDAVVRKIESDWLRVHLLIDRQLYISRLPSLSADYVLEKINVHQLITPEIREIRSWCIEKNIAVELDDNELELITDSKWCRFIIRQLLTNAVKYSPNGGTIRITADHSLGGHPVLSIKDEGPGIPAHDLPRIFDKGFTGSTGRLHNAATGLGLYLARQVAEKIGISLSAHSETDKGTTMTMTFSTENEFDATRT
ncbi:sensor histidine kinase [Sporosarcina highlanderae]|uniref:histidine kinase n=1 Tax=Sporosarcina highlanderae TaxID=3035916 RepID=A0ABT8JM77_9BACL|nr:sensor histidine kinase [Sporosarcina highlanderae]MDN4606147.1 sensor histidine kinase [Sporosarcina highlanderae]